METVLDRVSPQHVRDDPFPHIAITDALDDALCLQLLKEFPPLTAFDPDGTSNKRLGLSAAQTLGNPDVSPLWQEFIEAHSSQTFLNQLVVLFGPAIRREYPDFEQRVRGLENLRAGVRSRDDFTGSDVLLDAQISINTPVTAAPSSVRRVHLDNPDKLFAGLFYLREPDDDSTGGDLEICRYRGRPRGFRNTEIYDRFVEAVHTIRYERSTLVLFLNTSRSLHGVTVRSQTSYPRRFVNLVAEVEQPLFDVAPHQASVFDRVLAGPEIVRRRRAAAAV